MQPRRQIVRTTGWRATALSLTVLVASALLGAASLPSSDDVDSAQEFRERVEDAHGLTAWKKKAALEMDLEMAFGEKHKLTGRFVFDTKGAQARMELADGTVVVHDGMTAWCNRAETSIPGPMLRFHVLTWPWFAVSALRLGDSILSEPERMPLFEDGEPYPVVLQTFPAGAGDAPDDWYLLYRDPETNRLIAEAYIVTFGKTKEEAEAEPHVIVYDDFVTVDGVTLSKSWDFYLWTKERATHGEPIGKVRVKSYRFVTPDETTFELGPDAIELPMPGA